MGAATYYLCQLIVAVIGVVTVIGYVVYKALLYKSYEKNVRKVRTANW